MNASNIQKKIWAVALISAPILFIAAQFNWQNGVLTPTSGILTVLAFVLWIVAFQGLFWILRKETPVYAVIGFPIAAYACVAGSNFGMDGVYSAVLGVQDVASLEAVFEQLGGVTSLSHFMPGILFPISIITIGIVFLIKHKVNRGVAVLFILGGLLFPMSRIPRIEWLAHVDNFILLFSCIALANALFIKKEEQLENPRLELIAP